MVPQWNSFKLIIATDKNVEKGQSIFQYPKQMVMTPNNVKCFLHRWRRCWHSMSLRLLSIAINVKRQIIINPSKQIFSFMVNAFKAENHKEKSNIFNDKKHKANESYAIDNDILFDAFRLILMTISATKMKQMRICHPGETQLNKQSDNTSGLYIYVN
jgi:hypothetical protein